MIYPPNHSNVFNPKNIYIYIFIQFLEEVKFIYFSTDEVIRFIFIFCKFVLVIIFNFCLLHAKENE